jgi:dTDP-4-dehydrorhamnose 3,5-epimerase
MTKEIAKLKTIVSDGNLMVWSSGPMIDGVAVRHAKVLSDERGRLGEIMRADDPWFEKFGQVYVTTTYPGVVKAWHYHKKQTDNFYVAKGIVKIALYDERKDSPTCGIINQLYLGERCPGLLRIPPGIQHGWKCLNDTEAYLVNVVSEMYDRENPDEFRTHPHENHIPYDWTCKDG